MGNHRSDAKRRSSTVLFGFPSACRDLLQEARAAQLITPCSQQLSAGKATGPCLLVLCMHCLHTQCCATACNPLAPVVCSTAPLARIVDVGAGPRSWSLDSALTTCRTEEGSDSTNHASRTCPRAPEGVGGTPAPLPCCRPGARLNCIAQLLRPEVLLMSSLSPSQRLRLTPSLLHYVQNLSRTS